MVLIAASENTLASNLNNYHDELKEINMEINENQPNIYSGNDIIIYGRIFQQVRSYKTRNHYRAI